MAASKRLVTPFRAATRSQFISRPVSGAARAQTRWALPRRSFSVQPRLLEKKYTEDHEWVELSPDGKTGTIGITDYASKALGDVVYVELPSIDLEVTKGDTIGAVESVKSASDILTPISGKITETNSVLEAKPGTINKGPEVEGWLAKIQVQNATEMKELMSKEEYDKHAEGAGSE